MAGGIIKVGAAQDKDPYKPAYREQGKYDYFILHIAPFKWKVTKMEGDTDLGSYQVERIYKWDFGCTCPAGSNRKNCKHVRWVKEEVKRVMRKQNSDEIIP